jgi:hypothetical protein
MSAVYVLTLQTTDDERESIHGLRAVLKFARHRGLRAVGVCELPSNNHQTIHRRDARRRIVNTTQRRNEENTMTINLRKYGPANKWLKLEDLHGKPPTRERIGAVRVEDGRYGERIVLVFEPSGKMLSLNQTSTGDLLNDLGENDDDWLGRTIEIFAGEVQTKNGMTDAILVRGLPDVPADAAIAAKATKAAKSEGEGGDFNDEIDF